MTLCEKHKMDNITIAEGRLTYGILKCRFLIKKLRAAGLVSGRKVFNPLTGKFPTDEKSDISRTTIFIPRQAYPKHKVLEELHTTKFEGWFYTIDKDVTRVTINKKTIEIETKLVVLFTKCFSVKFDSIVRKMYLLMSNSFTNQETADLFLGQILTMEIFLDKKITDIFPPEIQKRISVVRRKLLKRVQKEISDVRKNILRISKRRRKE